MLGGQWGVSEDKTARYLRISASCGQADHRMRQLPLGRFACLGPTPGVVHPNRKSPDFSERSVLRPIKGGHQLLMLLWPPRGGRQLLRCSGPPHICMRATNFSKVARPNGEVAKLLREFAPTHQHLYEGGHQLFMLTWPPREGCQTLGEFAPTFSQAVGGSATTQRLSSETHLP